MSVKWEVDLSTNPYRNDIYNLLRERNEETKDS